MAKFPYEKPLLIDLQKNEALIGYGNVCETGGTANPGGGQCTNGTNVQGENPGACSSGLVKG